MAIRQAGEDYLEAMLMLKQERGFIRSVDVANKLDVTKPSVTYATKRLKEEGLITMDADNIIQLTPSGLKIAEDMLERHTALAKFLMDLGVDEEIAFEDACKMEHGISEESFDAICKHAGFQRKAREDQ